jgi:hypothetical protein
VAHSCTMTHHFRFISSILRMALSLPVVHAALSHQLCHLKPDDRWGGGLASKKGYPTSCPPGGEGRKPCRNGPPRCGLMGSISLRLSVKTTTTMTLRRTIERPRTGGFQDQALLGVLSCFRAPSGPWRLWFLCMSYGRGTTGGRCISSAFPDFGICSVLLSLGANPADRRGFASQQTLLPSTSGNTCVTWENPPMRRRL